MAALHTTAELFEKYRTQLALSWLAGRAGAGRSLLAPTQDADQQQASRVGYMNLSHPNLIQIIGLTELDYLAALDDEGQQQAIQRLFAAAPAMVIIADGEQPPPQVLSAAEASATPLLRSLLPGYKVVGNLDYYLSAMLAERAVVHGVFIEVMGIGVLLTGDSGIGKSELALELISRGHRLIADDAPEFHRIAPDTLNGICPPLLEGFLEVRGLGVLNIGAMFGDRAVKRNKYLRLIIHLQRMNAEQYASIDLLHGCRETRTILDVGVPQLTLPVAPGRNLAVLTESAALNHILVMKGYDAARDFVSRQKRYMAE
ncbi:MAG: HPr(Ser) kinase/phosphatase [Gammaproteobacteria bacterium]|nr:HPr(Ser) kinase/phosphatase [Gammaproteobacteria bacterium]